ncbi:zinc finger protein 271-like [Ischnura elegans]|uniref:zinc finger protein 271-like n=1 Tax=Ischnura elegans TaxID=197161 RepID=UPI001ED89945|nr:zinc finger protein 271-like [Ischnura elegans]
MNSKDKDLKEGIAHHADKVLSYSIPDDGHSYMKHIPASRNSGKGATMTVVGDRRDAPNITGSLTYGFNTNDDLIKHMEIHSATSNLDLSVESSIEKDESFTVPASREESNDSRESSTSETLMGLKRKRRGAMQKVNMPVLEICGGIGERKTAERVGSSDGDGKPCTQNMSSESTTSCTRKLRNDAPTLNENGEFIENLAMDVESTVGAAGLPAPERSLMKASSPSYLLALGDVRTDEKHGRIPPSTTVTCIQSKSEASHAEEGRNVIDKDLGKCSTLIHGEGTSCLFPSDGQSYTKDMQASKISGVGTRKSFVVVDCDALDATNTLGCIETREKADSGNEAVVGENEESSNYLIKNPGNSFRSNESSYHYLSTRDGFNSKDEVSKHMQTNLGARNLDGDAELSDYSCRICEKCFFRIDHLNEHMRSHVGDKPYVCDVCSKPISSKKNLVIHCRTHTGERPFSCSICCKSFYQSCDVTRHMRTHTMEKPYACSICCNRFSQSSGLVKHMLGHTGGKPYSCDICSKAFPKKRDLIMHGRTHAGEKPYPCDVCSNSFSTKKQLAIHCRTHTRGKPYSCDVCNKSFSTKSYFVVHCRTHTGWKPYSCDVCNKSLSSKNRLVVHCRTHSGEKPYACSICCKSFCERSVLTKHIRTHSGERPYSCNACSKSFSQRTGLNNHMRIHSGEKPYSCNVCSKSFTQTCNLYAHMLTHSGEKPFSCDVCNKAFSRKDNLVTHTRAHTGERPYSCSICRKSFYQSSGVTRHMRTHTGEKPFSCDVCKKPFLKKSELDIHCRTHT